MVAGIGFIALGIFFLLLSADFVTGFIFGIALTVIGSITIFIALYGRVTGKELKNQENILAITQASVNPLFTYSKFLLLYAGILFPILAILILISIFNIVSLVVSIIFAVIGTFLLLYASRVIKEPTSFRDFIFGLILLLIGLYFGLQAYYKIDIISVVGMVYNIFFGLLIVWSYHYERKLKARHTATRIAISR